MGESGDSGGTGGGEGTGIAVKVTAAAGGLGCLASPAALLIGIVVIIIIGGLGVLLAPLIALILFFGGGGGAGSDVDTDEVISALEGDGKGELDTSTVPEDLAEPIQGAGEICSEVGPVVIAAQIEHESGFDEELVGADGAEGISQLPPEVFEEFGEDEDDNDEVSALDPADSIMAQGRYLCSLVEEVEPFASPGESMRDVLSLALAAYDGGADAVRDAEGMPATSQAQGYVLAVRSHFATYEGIVSQVPTTPPDQTDDDGQ